MLLLYIRNCLSLSLFLHNFIIINGCDSFRDWWPLAVMTFHFILLIGGEALIRFAKFNIDA
jgi:hypothetical protein